jgi:peptide/nickel transport system substrate-binding protein
VVKPSGQLGEIDKLALSRREFLAGAGGVILAGGLAGCGGGSSSSSPAGSGSSGTPKPGGNFRLGVTGGSSTDIIDGQSIVNKPDQARLVAGWETLLTYDENYQLQTDGLAEEVDAATPGQVTIKLKSGITFHNGKPLTADDVIYSLKRIVNPKEGLFGAAGLASIDPKNMKKLDTLTVRVGLKQPDSTIPEQLGQYFNGVVPVGYERKGPLRYIGTGPFTVESFTPGQQSIHKKYANYWRSGEPHFDQVTVTDFKDSAAQVNALLSGQLDAITDIPFAQIDVAKSRGMEILEGQGAGWLPLCMAIDIAPFNDPVVRQAFRLIVDRQAMLEQVLSGHGRIANDLYSPFDACFNSSLPQRDHDPEKAKSMLASAGKSGLSVDLWTTNGAAGMVDSANVFASQAKDAGVNVKVHNDPNFYSNGYLKVGFSVDFWGTRNYLPQVALGSLPPPCPYNETHWPPKSGEGSNFVSLYNQALKETDQAKRCEIVHEMQKEEYDNGGYIIPFFNNLVDAHSSKVQGFKVSKATLNLDSFGHGFRTIWFA